MGRRHSSDKELTGLQSMNAGQQDSRLSIRTAGQQVECQGGVTATMGSAPTSGGHGHGRSILRLAAPQNCRTAPVQLPGKCPSTHFPHTHSSSAPGTCAQRGQVCRSSRAIPSPAFPVPLLPLAPGMGERGPAPPRPFGLRSGRLRVHSQHHGVSQGEKEAKAICCGSVLAEQGPPSPTDRTMRQR